MIEGKICRICGKEFLPNKYRRNQEVCSSLECQYKRQLENMKKWRETNPEYFKTREMHDATWKDECKKRSKSWRERHLEYLKLYRQEHKEEHRVYMKDYMREYRRKKKAPETNTQEPPQSTPPPQNGTTIQGQA